MPSLSDEYRNNHYVPQWYQKRFFLPGQTNNEFCYLNLKPEKFTDPRGVIHERRAIKRQGTKFCFVEKDLYTSNFGKIESTDIEKYFFGAIDSGGRAAVDYFTNFTHPSVEGDMYRRMLTYMGVQKLRTPKGLEWLKSELNVKTKNALLYHVQRLRGLFGAIWTECIWSIADASNSNTKFILSDHPVTIYNRACHPPSKWCRKSNDPDIRLHGSHTVFPLSLDKILILTNLSWVRNPYQSATEFRPNPNYFHEAIFKFTEIQTDRHLTEVEVLQINHIIKRRAWKYIAAAKEEWLYPETKIAEKWNKFGNGYLLMPDPRCVEFGGEIVIGHHDGTASWFDEYGRRPWDPDYGDKKTERDEFDIFYSFKGEFARLFGPQRRGRSFEAIHISPERDSDDMHQYYLGLEKKR